VSGAASGSISKYWVDVERSETHRIQLGLVQAGSRVLEIGAAAGHMTQALSAKNCKVTAVERDDNFATLAKAFCERLIVADIESSEFETYLVGEQFDVIIFGDVLEHLREPEKMLSQIRRYLAPNGYLVISLPNVAHASIRLTLLQGRFDYQPLGLLDRTHLRFFTLASLCSMVQEAGFRISDFQRIRCGFFDAEIQPEVATIPVATLRYLCQDPEATTYQFVFRAVPSGVAAPTSPADVYMSSPAQDVAKVTSELAHTYQQMGIQTLFANAPNSRRARRLLYRAFMLAPSLGRLGRLCASILPRRVLAHLNRTYERAGHRRGSG
jgi:2-polyprenyl-3-methyl-5-hydroxy-6-metoxy-1,4-benzoquinol methylase